MLVVHTFHTAMRMAMVATLSTVAIATAAGGLTSVPQANPKIVGVSIPTVLSPELRQLIVAQGSTPLENGAPDFPFYGYNGDGPMVPAPGDVQAPGHNVEATKTEPDKNTYLILSGQHGPDQTTIMGRISSSRAMKVALAIPKRAILLASTWMLMEPIASRCWPRRTWMGIPYRCSMDRPGIPGLSACSLPLSLAIVGVSGRRRLIIPRSSKTSQERLVVEATRASRTTRTVISGSPRTSVAHRGPSTSMPGSPTVSSIALYLKTQLT
jgi:hypothetical protein